MVLSGIKALTKGKKGSIPILLDRNFLHSHNLFSAVQFFRSCISEKKFYWNFLSSILQKQRLRIFIKLFQIIFWRTNFQNECKPQRFSTEEVARKILSEMSSSELSKPLAVVFQHKVEWFLYIANVFVRLKELVSIEQI